MVLCHAVQEILCERQIALPLFQKTKFVPHSPEPHGFEQSWESTDGLLRFSNGGLLVFVKQR